MSGVSFAQNIKVIEDELQEVLNQKSDELIDVTIIFKSQLKASSLSVKAERSSDKSVKKEIVVSELKDFSNRHQSDVMSVLQAEARNGNVADISAMWIVNAISCKATRGVIYMLSSHPDIAVLSYNKQVQLLEKEDIKDVEVPSTRGGTSGGYASRLVNADNVWWEYGYTGKNVVVAVLDSGTNFYHHDIRNNLWTAEKDGETIHGWNTINNNSDILDEFGHGTHCAGIVCGSNETGVAPDAQLMTVKVVGRTGTGSVAQMLNGIQFAIENGADVISMSLGFKSYQITTAQKEEIREAFDKVLESGVVVCAAAGNDGNSNGAPNNIDYPAACPSPWRNPDQTLEGGLSSVICVGANDLAASSKGPSTWQDTKYNEYPYTEGSDTETGLIRPDISAPGNLVYSLSHNKIDKYKLMSGTSQSTPSVAGVIALMLEKNPNLTPAEICEILETTAADKPSKKNNSVGSGRVDAFNAIKAVTAKNQSPFIRLNSYTPEATSPGDNKELVITMINSGKGASLSSTLKLETSSPYITINNPSVALGAILSGNTKQVPFTINISEGTPNNHNAYFTLTTTDGVNTWEDKFSINVSALSDLVYVKVNPSVINVNEQVDINVTMENTGVGDLNCKTKLKLLTTTSDLKHIRIIKDEATLEPIGGNETATGTFTIEAYNEETAHNYNIDFFLEIDTDSPSSTVDVVYEFEEDMEDWTTFDANNDDINNPYFHSGTSFLHGKTPKLSHSGTGHIMSEALAYSTNESTTPIDNFFVSPKVKVSSDSKIKFWARAHHIAYYAEHFGVAVSENSNNKSNDFTTIQEWNISKEQGTNWYEYTADLGAYAGKEIYVAIRHFFSQEQWNELDNGYYVDALNIDDIIITNIFKDYDFVPTYSNTDKTYFNVLISNPLEKVTGLKATAKSEEEIELTWDKTPRAKSYKIYRDNVVIANTETNSYTDKNVKHNTTYCYEVAAVAGGETFEHSEKVIIKTDQKKHSAVLTKFTPETIYIDGETSVAMNLTVLNDGSEQFLAKASYTLTCDDNTNVTINNNADYFKALNPNEADSKTISVKVSDNIANNSVIRFNLSLTSIDITEPFTFDLPFEVTVKNDVNAPKELTLVNKSDNSVSFSWRAVENALNYNVYRNGEYIDNTSSTTYFDNNGLLASTEYRYEVTGVLKSGESDKSEPLYVTTTIANNSVKLQSFNLSNTIGEATLTATFVNKGSAATPEETTATLICDDEYVTINNATVNLGSIAVDGTTTAEFSIIIRNDVPADYNIDFNAVVEYEGEVLKDLEYGFNEDFEGWTNYIWSGNNNYKWEYYNLNGIKCISSYSYKNGNRTPDNLICSPVKVKIKENTQLIYDVAATGNNYFKEHYGVYLIKTDPNGSYGWEELPATIYEKTLDDNFKNKKFVTETHDISNDDTIGNSVWVVFRHYGCKGQDAILIDNIKLNNVIIAGNLTLDNPFSVTANPSINIFSGDGVWSAVSNWSKGLVPTATDNVIIKGNATIENGDIIINNLLIHEGSLTIEDGANITITGEFNNTDAAAFIINEGAQVFQNNNNVEATFNKNIRTPKSWGTSKYDGWQFIASPIVNANVIDFIPTTDTDYDLFKYDGTKELQWINYKGHFNEFEKTFQLGTAYLASYEAETSTSFSGLLNNASSFDFDVTYYGEDSWANFHLLGNPFPFNMDWNKVTLENVYDGYAIVNPSDGSYMIYTKSENEGIIAAGEGFFVEAIGEAPSFSYSTSSKTRGENDTDNINVIATGKQGRNNVIIRFAGAEEAGFSKLANINPNIAEVYVKNKGKRYGILSYDENISEVELFFEAKGMGSYTISLDINGEFSKVTLIDRFTGIETNMLLEDEYTFTASGNDNANRFVIKLDNGQQTTANSQFVYQSGEELILSIEGSVQIVDMLGRVVYSNEHVNGDNRINVSEFNNATYVVRVVNEEGVKVQKVVIY